MHAVLGSSSVTTLPTAHVLNVHTAGTSDIVHR